MRFHLLCIAVVLSGLLVFSVSAHANVASASDKNPQYQDYKKKLAEKMNAFQRELKLQKFLDEQAKKNRDKIHEVLASLKQGNATSLKKSFKETAKQIRQQEELDRDPIHKYQKQLAEQLKKQYQKDTKVKKHITSTNQTKH